MILQIFLSCYMVYLFIKKLHEIIVISEDNTLLLISLITKYSLLSFIAYIGSFILFATSCVFIYFNMRGMGSIIFIIEWIVHFITFSLQFRFANSDYHLFCNKCNAYCFKIVVTTRSRKSVVGIDNQKMERIIKFVQNENGNQSDESRIEMGNTMHNGNV